MMTDTARGVTVTVAQGIVAVICVLGVLLCTALPDTWGLIAVLVWVLGCQRAAIYLESLR